MFQKIDRNNKFCERFGSWLPCSCGYADVGIRCRIPARWSSSGPPSEVVAPFLSLVSPMALASLSHRQCSRIVARRFGLGCLSDAIWNPNGEFFNSNFGNRLELKKEGAVYNTCKVFKLKNERWKATMILKYISEWWKLKFKFKRCIINAYREREWSYN